MKRNFGKIVAVSSLVIFLMGCGGNSETEQKERPMVYEGMPASDLENLLGEPERIDSAGTVYDVDEGIKKQVQKWYYKKRTVILINDTVLKPNLPNVD